MHLCAISFKPCWQADDGSWRSDGGFPLQMGAVGSLFDSMTLVITEVPAKAGGIPLPSKARVVPLRQPIGQNLRRKFSVIGGAPEYLRVIHREVRAADVVHVPLPGDIPLLGMITALLRRKRLIVRYGGSWAPTATTTVMNRVTRELMRRFAGGRNVMLVAGGGDRPPSPGVRWLPSTALTAEELRAIRAELDRGLSSPPHLIYAGRLSPEKGVAYLIDALAVLKRSADPAYLPRVTLAGDGPERAALETRVDRAGCGPLVRFAGQLDRQALSRAMLVADLCVQPSMTEGYSKAWIDAMAHGLPVLASEVGAARQVIGGDGVRGWTVPPGDARALADALTRVLSGPADWPALRRRCRRHAEGQTLEAWAGEIGRVCSAQWGVNLEPHGALT